MAITNKSEATDPGSPNGVYQVIPTNGSGNILASNFHTYLGDLVNWIFPGAGSGKGAVLTTSDTSYGLEWNVLIPVGCVMYYTMDFGAGLTVPSGWLLCDGSEVAQTTYPDLFALLGTYHSKGATPSAGNFFLPKIGDAGSSTGQAGVAMFRTGTTDDDPVISIGVDGTPPVDKKVAMIIKY